jgi:hypothetical protein
MLVAMALTAIALTAGIIIMGKGGETNIKYGNKFMRARILFQGMTLVCFALFLLTSA